MNASHLSDLISFQWIPTHCGEASTLWSSFANECRYHRQAGRNRPGMECAARNPGKGTDECVSLGMPCCHAVAGHTDMHGPKTPKLRSLSATHSLSHYYDVTPQPPFVHSFVRSFVRCWCVVTTRQRLRFGKPRLGWRLVTVVVVALLPYML